VLTECRPLLRVLVRLVGGLGCTLACVMSALPALAAQRISDHLYGARLISAQEGWVVGNFGSIYHTIDGGASWRPQVSNSTEQLYSVDFADTKHGWIVGRSGLLLATTDGGESWRPQTSGTANHLFEVKALDAAHVWVVGDWGTVLYTSDGGKTWQNRSLQRDVILNGLSWADAQHGWIVGEAGAILTTTDGGNTWTEQHSGVEKTLFGVFFETPQRGWATGIDGLILATTDGGQTWQVQNGQAQVGELEQVGFADTIGNPSVYDVAVAGQYGYAVGENGTVFVSQDGGSSWQRGSLPGDSSLRWLRAIALVPGTHGLFVGGDGLTVRVAGLQMTSGNDEHASQAIH
jgi:photosystem II stability/assembly factor-like uncharacterized protein